MPRFGITGVDIGHSVQFGGKDYFMAAASTAADPSYGGIGSTDGTAGGTTFIPVGGLIGQFTPETLDVVNGKLLVSGRVPPAHGDIFQKQIWASSDGTSFSLVGNGVSALTDYGFVNSGNVAYFVGMNNGNAEVGLWRTDGTAAGTFAVSDPTGVMQSIGSIIPAANGRVVFTIQDPATNTYSLWSAGSTAGSAQQITNAALGSNILAGYSGASARNTSFSAPWTRLATSAHGPPTERRRERRKSGSTARLAT